MATDDTTRTPEPKDGDAAEHTQTTDTGAKDGRDDQPAADKAKQDALVHKVKAEQLNALLKAHGVSSVEELNERLAQSPAAPASSPPPEDATYEARREQRVRKIQAYIEQGDELAALVLEQQQQIEDLRRGTVDALSLGSLDPDLAEDDEETRRKKAFRARVVKRYNANRHRLGDLEAAAAEVRQYDLSKKNRELAERLRTLEKKPDPDVLNAPSIAGRESAATETLNRKKMRGSEFDDQVDALERQGKHLEAVKLRGKLRRGEISLVD